MFACDTIYNDKDADQIESLPPSNLHRNVDLEIMKADKQGSYVCWDISCLSCELTNFFRILLIGYVKTYIVLPSTIYGIASGKLVDLGIQNIHSQQIPALIKVSLARGQAGMVGEGKNIWPHVHIDESKYPPVIHTCV